MASKQNKQQSPGFVGVDLGHKNWKACRYSATGDHMFKEGAMTKKGIRALAHWLNVDDTVAIETGTGSNWFKRTLQSFLSVRVIMLNAMEIKLISGSLKKTDKEDALKLAQLIAKYTPEELHTVRPRPALHGSACLVTSCHLGTADEKSELLRKLTSERRVIVENAVKCRSRFYALCIQAGYTTVRKRDFRTAENMRAALHALPERYRTTALRLIAQQQLFEQQLEEITSECTEKLSDHTVEVNILTSMPGVGPITALAFIAYLGDCSEFSDAGAVSYYAGLVPRIDQSSTLERKCGILRRGNVYLRTLMIQAAWALVRSKQRNRIQDFYERTATRIGSHKAIVATARKMLETLYVMVQRRTVFDPGGCHLSAAAA